MRQQRTNNARGRLPFPKLATAPDVPWTIDSLGDANQTARVAIPSVSGVPQLNGIPAMTRDGFVTAPTSALLVPGGMWVTWPDAVPNGTVFRLPAKDPAWRTSIGSYLSAGASGSPADPPVPSVDFFNDTQTIAQFFVNIPNAGAATCTLSPGLTINAWLIIAVPSTFGADITASPVTGDDTVSPNEVGLFTWDGAAWTR
jgi:hypothetical protein